LCVSCKVGTFLEGGVCYPNCPTATNYGDTTTNTCKVCDTAKCATCNNFSTDSNCKTCPLSKFLRTSD